MAFKNGNILARLANIPLLNSAYQIAAITYADIKGANPLVGFLCDVTERSTSTMVGLAMMAATPVLKRLEVPLAALNSFTLRGLDELEARFPILDQPADEVLGSLQDSLVTSVGQLRARTAERLGQLRKEVSGVVVNMMGTTALGLSIFLNTSGIGLVLEPGATAALSLMEQLVDRYLPAMEEEMRRPASSLRGREQIPESERSFAGRLRLLIVTSARRVYWRAWSYAEELWRVMRRVLTPLLEFAVALRRRLHRALVALIETDDSDPGPRPGFPQDAIPVPLAQRRRSSLGTTSSRANSHDRAVKKRIQDESDHMFTATPAQRGLSATLNWDTPAKKAPSLSPSSSQRREGRDLSHLGQRDMNVESGHQPFLARVE